ncbi:MAG: hypothetical protein JST20_12990 [Bacteroidetes bacterium]|nr:hypothetical protein [Bacteroidota bacterium]
MNFTVSKSFTFCPWQGAFRLRSITEDPATSLESSRISIKTALSARGKGLKGQLNEPDYQLNEPDYQLNEPDYQLNEPDR